MLKRYYSPHLITNPGEKAFDKALEDLYDDGDRTWHAVYQPILRGDRGKKVREIDFMLVTREGVIAVEVKGGRVGVRNGQFMHLADGREYLEDRPMKEHPIHQAHGCSRAIIDLFQAKEIKHTLVTQMVAFPQCHFGETVGENHIIWSRAETEALGEFMLGLIRHARSLTNFEVRDLSPSRQEEIARMLAPTYMPPQHLASLLAGKEHAERRKAENERILDGLQANRRVMIQGPPGSGKSPYAFRYMARQAEKDLKGLYLCWNELLAKRMEQLIAAESLQDNVTVSAFYPFAQRLLSAAGVDASELNFETLRARRQLLADLLAQTVDKDLGADWQWDYIVADESQDLFHLGIEQVLKGRIRGTRDGLGHGQYLILYDLTSAEDVDLGDTYTTLLQHAAHYQLAGHYRGTGGDGLNQFIDALDLGDDPLNGTYGSDVKVVRFGDLRDVPRKVSVELNTMTAGKKNFDEAILLLHSDYLKPDANGAGALKDELDKMKEAFEFLTPENLASPPTKLRYTSILKYKGLDKPIVFLVLPPQLKWDKKMHHQLLVGASRASVKLCVLAPEG